MPGGCGIERRPIKDVFGQGDSKKGERINRNMII